MTVLEPQRGAIPVPTPSLLAEPYWEGCRIGELRYLRCERCAAIPPLPVPVCPRCQGRALAWRVSAGRGVLSSWTVVWRPQHPAFQVPYAPVIVEMAEGFRLLSAAVGCAPEALGPGLAVQVEFHPAGGDLFRGDIVLPYVQPVASG